MIVADSNVISEFMRDSPVIFGGVPWAFDHAGELAITSITRFEILAGIRFLPDSRRKRRLAAQVDRYLAGRHCLPFDSTAAEVCADVVALRRAQGRVGEFEDCMIAAICLSRGLPLATRNVRHFTGLGLTLIDPWEGGG